ncbi:MAG: hypothetical protein IPM82_01370 [Saprospiraceae bacterium]|nr:hypothetical protein [Saprospiraceae bacterium]
MEKLNDLRFIIGLFFALVGALLVVLAFALNYDKGFGKNLNLYAGLAMLVFGGLMLWAKRKDR